MTEIERLALKDEEEKVILTKLLDYGGRTRKRIPKVLTFIYGWLPLYFIAEDGSYWALLTEHAKSGIMVTSPEVLHDLKQWWERHKDTGRNIFKLFS